MIAIADTLTDAGNGQRFARDHHEAARWLIDEQEWRIWDDTHWRAYKTDERAMELAKATVATIYQEAAAGDSDEDRKKIGAWARTSQNGARLQAMIKMANACLREWQQPLQYRNSGHRGSSTEWWLIQRIFALVKKSVQGALRFGPLRSLLIAGIRDYVLARVSTPSISVGITAQTHRIALVSLPVLPVIPIVEAKATLPWSASHAQNCAPVQTVWEGTCPAG